MATFFSQEQVDALANNVVRCPWAAEFQFKSETVRIWSGSTWLDANDAEWRPTHGAVQIDGLGFTGEAVSKQISLTVSGVDADFLLAARSQTDEADQQPMRVFMLFLDEDWQVIPPMVPLGTYLMQPPQVSRTEIEGMEGAEQTVTLTAENLFYNRSRPANGRYTPSDQAKRVGWNDRFFDFIPSLINRSFRWPTF